MQNLKGNIIIKLINKENNMDILEDIAYIPFLDLAITFRILIGEDKNSGQIAYAGITKDMLTKNNMTMDELYKIAIENTKNKYPFIVTPIYEKMLSIIKSELPSLSDAAIDNILGGAEFNDLYCATNSTGILGASFMLYKDELKAFADRINIDKVIILPCSIHEVLLVDYHCGLPLDAIKSMVPEINANELLADEILSDNVYLYDVATNEVTIL